MSKSRCWSFRVRWILALVGAAALLLTGCGPDQAATAPTDHTLYTCGMHPQVVQDHPGNCPICGMKLTPVRQSPGTVSNESSAIAINPVTEQNMGIRTALVRRGPLRRLIRTVGVIDYNETTLADVTTKFKGWVEKLYVDATGQQVHRGDPLFEIYSPELYSAQREYLLALEQPTNVAGSDSLTTSALTKLKFFDISGEQIAELQRTREPSKTLRIVAPQDGFVTEKAVIEGQMVEPGMKMYRLADLGLVWVQAQVYEQDLPYIRLGQEVTVTLSYLSDREFRGRVTYIYPNIDEKTRTARVRMEFHNPGYFLKPGMFATVHVLSELEPSVLLVPDMAILRSGEKNTVFVALEQGRFEPRDVTLGPQAENDMYQVTSGLKEGERIVTSGQFMLDSESQLREAIQKMREPKQASPGSPPETNPVPGHEIVSTELAGSLTNRESVKYICPMPEHVSIQYDHPGKCPICGMTLVPVTQAALARLHPGGKLLFYTCPMPEHSDVRSDRPSKCPKCGMTLIPVMAAPPAAPGTGGGAEHSARGNAEGFSAPGAQDTRPLLVLYTCPMAAHAEVVSTTPGRCPKCDMNLVLTRTVEHGKAAEEAWRKRQAP